MTRIHAHLNFAGNAEEAFEHDRSVFGGEFGVRWMVNHGQAQDG